MILGISGTNGSGKDTAAAYFETHGFLHLSLSEAIRDTLRSEGQPLTKEAQIAKGLFLRQTYGDSILARRVAEKILPQHNYVITSIRHPAEAEYFRKLFPDFLLLYIDADPLLRFQRVKERFSPSFDYQSFLLMDQAAQANTSASGQQILLCAKQADFHILNNSTQAAFTTALHNILSQQL